MLNDKDDSYLQLSKITPNMQEQSCQVPTDTNQETFQ